MKHRQNQTAKRGACLRALAALLALCLVLAGCGYRPKLTHEDVEWEDGASWESDRQNSGFRESGRGGSAERKRESERRKTEPMPFVSIDEAGGHFSDPGFEAYMRAEYYGLLDGDAESAPFTQAALDTMTELKLNSNDENSMIGGLTDLRYFRNLEKLSITLTQSLGFDHQQMQPLQHLVSLTAIMLDIDGLTDCSGLAHLPALEDLTIYRGVTGHTMYGWEYRDMEPLQGVSDLGGLTTLQELTLRNCGITDIRAFENLTGLTYLNLDKNDIQNIDALRGLTSLKDLYLMNNPIKSIDALRGLTSLRALYLTNSPIKNIDALRDLTSLKVLVITNSPIKSVDALRGLPNLWELQLIDTRVADLSVLSELPALERLVLGDNELKDISFLADLSLVTELVLINTGERIEDLSPIARMSRLDYLHMEGWPENELIQLQSLLPNCIVEY